MCNLTPMGMITSRSATCIIRDICRNMLAAPPFSHNLSLRILQRASNLCIMKRVMISTDMQSPLQQRQKVLGSQHAEAY